MGSIVMNGTLLRLYVHENRKHGKILLYEWLLEQAKALGIHGGSAFRAIAGFGRHGILREERFFELAGDVPVVIDFAVSDDDANRLLDLLRAQRINVFYVRMPIEFGAIAGST
jgi:PII-like signaling protein